jgi:hypothetical protein
LRVILPVNLNRRVQFYPVTINQEKTEPVLPESLMQRGYCMYIDCPQLLADGRLMKCVLGYSTLSLYPASQGLRDCKQLFFDVFNPTESLEDWRLRFPFDACQYCTVKPAVPHSFGDGLRIL